MPLWILIVLAALFLAAVYVAYFVVTRHALPFFELVQDWSIATVLADDFYSKDPVPFPQRSILTRRDVPNVSSECVADPFILKEKERFFLFAEVLNEKTCRGEIGFAESTDGLRWEWKGTALREPFHLSFPFVFRDGPDVYMIPETGSQKAVYLYQADPFPGGWRRVATLLEGLPFNDTSIFQRNGLWWMFTGIHPYVDDTLCLFYSEHIRGPWQPHPMNPIISGNPEGARPGGKVVEADGKLYRFGQNCSPYYGFDLNTYEITELTPQRYAEKLVPHPFFSKKMKTPSWMAHGHHHLDVSKLENGRWLIATDGFCWRWRFGMKRRMRLRELMAIFAGIGKRKGDVKKTQPHLKPEGSKRAQILKNLGSNYLLSFVGMAMGFFLVPFLIGKLGKETYGLVVLAESVVMFFEIVTVSIRVALSRYATVANAQESKEDFVGYLSTGRVIMYVSAALVLVAGIFVSAEFPHFFKVAPELTEESRKLFFLITLGVSCSIPNTVYWTALYAKQRYELINLASSFGLVLRAFLIFVLFSVLPLTWQNLVLYGLVYLGMMLTQNMMIYIFHYRLLPGMKYPMSKFQRHKVKEILSFSGHTSVSRISILLYTDTANIIINKLWGPGYNAIYSVALKFPIMMSRIFIEPSWVLTTTFTDLVARGEQRKVEDLFFLYSKILSVVTYPMCFVLFFYAKEFILMWVGPDFAMAGELLPIFVMHLFLAIPFSLVGCLFNAYGKVKAPSLATLVLGILNVVLCFMLGGWLSWKVFGIAWAGIISGTVIGKIWTSYYGCKISGLSLSKYWIEVFVRPLLFSGLIMISAYRLVIFFEPAGGITLAAFLTLAAASTVFYFLSYYGLFSNVERGYISETVRGVRRKVSGIFERSAI